MRMIEASSSAKGHNGDRLGNPLSASSSPEITSLELCKSPAPSAITGEGDRYGERQVLSHYYAMPGALLVVMALCFGVAAVLVTR